MSLHERIHQAKAWRSGPGIQEGVDAEKAILGRARVEPGEIGYMGFREAVAFAKEHQPNIAERSVIVRHLREKVALYATDKEAPVRFYTAVGTPLDLYHGVDAFFEQGARMVTLDVSLREKESYKADVLLVASMDREGKVGVNPQEIADVAAKVATKLEPSASARAA